MSIERKRIISFVLVLFLCLSIQIIHPVSAAAETEIDKVLTQISHEPVALMEVRLVSATTTTEGCTLTSAVWKDKNGNQLTTYFDTGTYQLELKLEANEGYIFAENVAAYVNNSSIAATRDETGKYLTITRDYVPLLWQPTVIKHPGAETVMEGEWTSFVATATYTSGYEWSFVDASGKSFSCDSLVAKFPAVTVNGNGSGKIIVYNIPFEMNGWKAVCSFSGLGGSIDSNGALITVKQDPAKATPSPSPSPSPSPEPEVDEHEHEYDENWVTDENRHWKQCECGEKSESAAHKFTWTITKEASPSQAGESAGVCDVCAYSAVREDEYIAEQGDELSASMKTFRWILTGLFIALAGIIAVLIIQSAKDRKRRKKRRH